MFVKVDESCLLSMKMNGQDFLKKQSLLRSTHPVCSFEQPLEAKLKILVNIENHSNQRTNS